MTSPHAASEKSATPEIDPIQIERPWGKFRRFTKNAPSTVKIITVNPGASLSLQSHAHRGEFWHVISGSGTAEIDGEKHEAVSGKELHIPVGAKHRLSANEGSVLEILEITIGDFDEGDIVRYEDKYGRATE
jgi:mannose-6-phosphate isomerase